MLAEAHAQPGSASTTGMRLYDWQGIAPSDRPMRGRSAAASRRELRDALRADGIVATRIDRVSRPRGRRIDARQLAMFTQHLPTLLSSGVTLLQALDLIARGHANRRFTELVEQLRATIEAGHTLAEALREHPRHFDTLYCNLVEAGELSGTLEDVLERLAQHQERSLALRRKLRAALTYPMLVVLVAIAVTIAMLIFIIPTFEQAFASMGAELPWPTMIVIDLSSWLRNHFALLLGMLAALMMALRTALRRSLPLRRRMEDWLLHLPVIGELLRKAALVRWSRTLATLFAAGLPLLETLRSVSRASGSIRYRDATLAMRDSIQRGHALSQAMEDSRIFEPMVVQMLRIGEETGRLDLMLKRIADYHEDEIDRTAAMLSSLLEPLIVVTLGVVVGGLVLAMYLPIFRLGQLMS